MREEQRIQFKLGEEPNEKISNLKKSKIRQISVTDVPFDYDVKLSVYLKENPSEQLNNLVDFVSDKGKRPVHFTEISKLDDIKSVDVLLIHNKKITDAPEIPIHKEGGPFICNVIIEYAD